MSGTLAPDRLRARAALLHRAGWAAADRRFLAGDASDRSYERLRLGGRSAVLMDAPPGKGDDPAAFLAIAGHLRGIGLSAPHVLAQDLAHGFLLLEDLGDGLFTRLIASDPALELPLTLAAADVLLHLQAHPAPAGLPDLTAAEWSAAAALALDWYGRAATGAPIPDAGFEAELAGLMSRHADGPRVMILRDYHAENLLWLPDRQGLARVGLLDFQLAQMGQPGYDLVSLLQDVRREVSPDVAEQILIHVADRQGLQLAEVRLSQAVLGAQRALRILGVFARLCLVAGKPGYVRLMPRVWGHLQANLAHPGLDRLAAICNGILPPPTPQTLARIERQCPTPPKA